MTNWEKGGIENYDDIENMMDYCLNLCEKWQFIILFMNMCQHQVIFLFLSPIILTFLLTYYMNTYKIYQSNHLILLFFCLVSCQNEWISSLGLGGEWRNKNTKSGIQKEHLMKCSTTTLLPFLWFWIFIICLFLWNRRNRRVFKAYLWHQQKKLLHSMV